MEKEIIVNDLVVRFANVNGTGSASANEMFAKSIFRMGIPVTPKNIFPSNIQGLPTWYEVRISEKGHLGRRAGIDILVGVNPQSLKRDIESVSPGGYFVYDSSKKLHEEFIRADINYIGIPMIKLAMKHYPIPRLQQLLKNMIYVGAVATLIDLELDVLKGVIAEQFSAKPKIIPSNYQALELGINYVKENFKYPLNVRIKRCDNNGDSILIDGNTACGLGAIYAGATVMAWYPITPSTSVAKAFESYCKKLRIDEDGKKKYAFVQAEDELAAIGMVIGATWNGARAFTATSGPGVSLMNEFIGLSYFAEIPVVLINVQRGGPSTGMPTRTQQADLISSAYASHGDTKHVLLFPSSPAECFEFTINAFDLADRLQTLVMLISDLDLGMNNHMSPPLAWDDDKKYDLGKVFSAEDLEEMKEDFGRYLDVDGDAIPYRTIPGTHPTKGSFFTRGTSHDEYAKYSELGEVYLRNVDRLSQKWETAKTLVPEPEFYQKDNRSNIGLLFFGTTTYAAVEAMELFEEEGLMIDSIRVRAFPFHEQIGKFIEQHEQIIVVEQNRDAQFRTLLINELELNPSRLISVVNYDGMPITAQAIQSGIKEKLSLGIS
ncbi:2-oxoacid:acceptor oxidoreductase subunit alpha [Saprospiraceae bacterium]|jgi:2-oxoglutarate ferredoxin oxidoreductase subunit alpha|nr:2-oxoacid:acceptor oxidoreductase subunit alpha [Saprospiraceae bacterium]MDG1433764.1 2-oxoacid:acceptor oxidoreductase subunit alpha [Saprospiraceae bacterium]